MIREFMFRYRNYKKTPGYILRKVVMPMFDRRELRHLSYSGMKIYDIEGLRLDIAKLIAEYENEL